MSIRRHEILRYGPSPVITVYTDKEGRKTARFLVDGRVARRRIPVGKSAEEFVNDIRSGNVLQKKVLKTCVRNNRRINALQYKVKALQGKLDLLLSVALPRLKKSDLVKLRNLRFKNDRFNELRAEALMETRPYNCWKEINSRYMREYGVNYRTALRKGLPRLPRKKQEKKECVR